MKKWIRLFLSVIILFAGLGFTACADGNSSNSNSKDSLQETTLENERQTIIRAYEERYNVDTANGDYAYIIEYYGKFNSGAIVALMSATCFDHPAVVRHETVGDIEFIYPDSNRIIVLYQKEFFTLPEAYENGYLSAYDLADVYLTHNLKHYLLYD
ncbi:MAG: hypothetical protein IJ308_06740 [Clostridia bacterium]|nr:hypothetical protein [Clostridia bacterium]